MTARITSEQVMIPASHQDLLARAICGVLATVAGDGQPHSSLVCVDGEGSCARVKTTLQRQQSRNLLANPKVSLLVVDPDNTSRFIQIRGDAKLTEDRAVEHLDALIRKYTTHPRYYGYVYPADQPDSETRVICTIHARRITLDAIHA
jgi:PPOX class probable F420-dependent enzyme